MSFYGSSINTRNLAISCCTHLIATNIVVIYDSFHISFISFGTLQFIAIVSHAAVLLIALDFKKVKNNLQQMSKSKNALNILNKIWHLHPKQVVMHRVEINTIKSTFAIFCKLKFVVKFLTQRLSKKLSCCLTFKRCLKKQV